MNSPLIYRYPLVYQAVMRLLYGRYFQARYTALASEVPDGSSVVEVCAGDCYLYRRYLRPKKVDYLALDLSSHFVSRALARGINARVFNLWQELVPPTDVVVMQGSLYQFLPKTRDVIHRLINAARVKVIVAESIRNLSDSPNPLLAAFSRKATHPAAAPDDFEGQRFNEARLVSLFQQIDSLDRYFLIPGGRDMIGIFRGKNSLATAD